MKTLFDLDVLTLGQKADAIRRKLHGTKLYFNTNKHINPTNICKDVCKFCAFSASRKNPHPYAMTKEEILRSLDEAIGHITEVHIVGAHNKEMALDFYTDLFRTIKQRHPHIHLKAMTAAEVNFFAEHDNISYETVLSRLADSGVDSMPGGGAEIFDETLRKRICGGKVTSENWIAIHRIWHKMGKKSNATMLFGHLESREHRIDHIERIRALQDETGGFNAFIPLVYNIENNYLDVAHPATGQDILKTIAISRLLLDNVPHIKAYWVAASLNLALVAAEFGADDLDGTIQAESIISKAGAHSEHGIDKTKLIASIKNAGFTPVERDSLYHELKIYE